MEYLLIAFPIAAIIIIKIIAAAINSAKNKRNADNFPSETNETSESAVSSEPASNEKSASIEEKMNSDDEQKQIIVDGLEIKVEPKSSSDDNRTLDHHPLMQIVYNALERMHCNPHLLPEYDLCICAGFQGEEFFLDFNSDPQSAYIGITDPKWSRIKSNDSEIGILLEAINEYQFCC